MPLTAMVSQPVWSNGWWWITAPSSCVHVTQTAQGSEQIHTASGPLLKLVIGGGVLELQAPSVTHVRVPCDTHLTCYCTQKTPLKGAWMHLNLFFRGFIFQGMNKMSNLPYVTANCSRKGVYMSFTLPKLSQVRAPICRRHLYISQRRSQSLQIVNINETELLAPAP